MVIPKDSICEHCRGDFSMGGAVYATYSDVTEKECYFHFDPCWRRHWTDHLDCVPTKNRRENPS